jgi:glyoxylase-like metal-dependent hydrolase (beta-lactamase superfamily II)
MSRTYFWGISRRAFSFCLLLSVVLIGSALAGSSEFGDIPWERLRPLDSNPELDSGVTLDRPCVPGETVVVRTAVGRDSTHRLGLHEGQFVVCTGNTADGHLLLADGPGNIWPVRRNQVNATRQFPANWLAHDRDYLVWAYSRDTIIFRESLGNGFEGNFFYLLLDLNDSGHVTAGILIDSGTGHADLAPYLKPLIGDAPLLVVSTHSHWDHFGGHRHLRDLPNVELQGYQPATVYNPYPESPEYDLDRLIRRFAFEEWPAAGKDFNIGQRRFAAIPVPGHTGDSIAFYDYQERLLFTGDVVCPCYLFIEDWIAFTESLDRLAAFAAQQPVRWLLGGHVEMSQPRPWNHMHEYFFFGSNTHWNPLPVQMAPDYLTIAQNVIVEALARSPGSTPQYDARLIDPAFHALPVVAIPFPGIPSYFRVNSERLVEQLRLRHAEHDSRRLLTPVETR